MAELITDSAEVKTVFLEASIAALRGDWGLAAREALRCDPEAFAGVALREHALALGMLDPDGGADSILEKVKHARIAHGVKRTFAEIGEIEDQRGTD